VKVTVLHAPAPRQVLEHHLELPAGATIRDALQACGLAGEDPAAVGIWGRKAPLEQPLREGDRVEVCRPLLVDPKVARRERFRRQGSRAAGLFASRRPGAKPGY
jgi:putative ubiquitin-RnfH superfamily antitoxin RatB of RatAB toxin-antitoxin module